MFAFDYWCYIYSELRAQTELITTLLSDQEVLAVYAKKHSKLIYLTDGSVATNSELSKYGQLLARYGVSSASSDARATYYDQLCVLIYSYVEAILEDFFIAVFATHPDKMSNHIKDHYAAQSHGNGALEIFQRTLRSESREQFINEMARIAAKQATNGGNAPGKIMQRIAALLKADMADHRYVSLTTSLTRLKEHRNFLVHEPRVDFGSEIRNFERHGKLYTSISRTAPVNKIPPDSALETFQRLIYYLGDLCLKNQVPVYDAPPGATGVRLVSADELSELDGNLLPDEIWDGYYTHWTSD